MVCIGGVLMICPQCGKQIKDSAAFCPSCGISTGYEGNPAQSNRFAAKKQEYSFLLIPVAFILIVLIGFFIFNSNRKIKELDRYFLSISECDSDTFYSSLFSQSIVEDSVDDFFEDNTQTDSFLMSISYSLAKDDYIASIKQQARDMQHDALVQARNELADYYGDDFIITYKIKKMEQMSSAEISELKNYYKSTYPAICYSYDSGRIRQGKTVKLKYTIKGSKNSFTNVCSINIYRTIAEGWLIDERILDHMPLYAN